jgi:hypothetical protein
MSAVQEAVAPKRAEGEHHPQQVQHKGKKDGPAHGYAMTNRRRFRWPLEQQAPDALPSATAP